MGLSRETILRNSDGTALPESKMRAKELFANHLPDHPHPLGIIILVMTSHLFPYSVLRTEEAHPELQWHLPDRGLQSHLHIQQLILPPSFIFQLPNCPL